MLVRIEAHLNPGGLFFFGVYGGTDFEGIWPEDSHEPKRFFAYYDDQDLLRRVLATFELVYFRRVQTTGERDSAFHFQSMI